MDNGIKIFNYNGELIYEEDITELFHVHWRPQPPDTYPVQPIVAVAASPRAKKIAPVAAPKPYRHPHFSGNSSVSQAPKATPTRYTPGVQGARSPPGGTPVGGTLVGGTLDTGSPGSSAGRGRGKKKKKGGRGGGGGRGIPGEHHKPEKLIPQQQPQQPQPQQEQEQQQTTGEDKAIELDPEKRKRNVLKKLREIEVLKQRQSNGDTLNVAQLTKIGTEDSLRAEMGEIDS